jgi:hypothetical protein
LSTPPQVLVDVGFVWFYQKLTSTGLYKTELY